MTKTELLSQLRAMADENKEKYKFHDAWNETVEASEYADNLETLKAAIRWIRVRPVKIGKG